MFRPSKSVIRIERPKTEPEAKQPPVMPSTPILYSDLTGIFPSDADVTAIVRAFNRTNTFFMLAMVNSLVSFFAHEPKDAIEIQKFLVSNFVEPDLLKVIEQTLKGESILQHPLFHRQVLLALQRRVLLEAALDGARDPNPPANVADKYLLGRACLMMNNLLMPREQEERLKNTGEPGEDERIHGELFAQWLPTAEMLNRPDPAHSIVRHLEYAKIFDESYAAYTFGEGRTLSERFEELTGIELKKFLFFIFNLDLYYRSNSREDLVENPALFNIDINTVFRKLKITEREVQAFFNLLTTDVEGLRDAFTNVTQAAYLVPPHFDVKPFRTYPLVYRNAERTIVTCADPAFLEEKISSGAYHTILRALEVDEKVRDERDEADRKEFLKRYWGEVFEIYINARLRELYPLSTNRFYASPKWDSPRAQRNNEAFDGFIDCGDAVIAIECKGKYLSLNAKYSANRELLLADLNERFGRAARQLAQKLEIAFNREPGRRHGFSQRDENNRPLVSYNPEFARTIRRIYPITIVQDPSLRIGFANRELRKIFEAEISQKVIDHKLIKPLSLLTVEDFEVLIPYLSDISFTELLDEYTRSHEPLCSFRYVMNQYLERKGIERRQNEWIMQRFDGLRESLRNLFTVFD
jgi:hypothetical protein